MMLRAAICMSISVGGPLSTEEGLVWGQPDGGSSCANEQLNKRHHFS